jgi:hypothetical protein
MDNLFNVISSNKVGDTPELCLKLRELKKTEPEFSSKMNERLESKINNILETVKNNTTKDSIRSLVSGVLNTNKSGNKTTLEKMELYIPIMCKCSSDIV